MNALRLLEEKVRYLRTELKNEEPGTRREMMLLARLKRTRTALYAESKANPAPAQAAWSF